MAHAKHCRVCKAARMEKRKRCTRCKQHVCDKCVAAFSKYPDYVCKTCAA